MPGNSACPKRGFSYAGTSPMTTSDGLGGVGGVRTAGVGGPGHDCARTGSVRAQQRTTGQEARAFAFIWSNSAWVIVPSSRSFFAEAIWSALDPPPPPVVTTERT